MVPGLDEASIDELVFLHHGHAEAGQVVAAGGVEARHLSGFTPQQGTAALGAAVGNAHHHLRHRCGAELAGGDVIEEEERFGAAGDHVVGAHGHQIDAHPVVALAVLGQLQLGAHPVGAGHQQGLAQACR